jgi:protein-tyrosine-phosphatase
MAGDEFPPSEAACHACMVRGIDITDHRSRPLTEEVVRWADVILTMERRHLDRVRELGGGGKATLLTDYPGDHGGGTEIEDPIGRGARVYEDVFEQLEKEISRVIRSLGGKGPADKRQGRGDLRSRGR